MSSRSQHQHDHSHHDGACGCALNPQAAAVAQNLDEMAFERGLWGAALNGDISKLSNLLKKGANPNEWDQSGFMPLHYASRANQTEAVRLLLQYGADPNGKTRAGATTPLHRAAFMGHIDIVKLLLAAKADSSLQDYDLTSPLHKAASQDHYDVIEILLKAGSRADVVDKNGKLPVDLLSPKSNSRSLFK